MQKIEINEVVFVNQLEANQLCSVYIRNLSLPDTPENYTLVYNSVTIKPDGAPADPIVISDLPDNGTFAVKIKNNCDDSFAIGYFPQSAAPTTAPQTTATTVAATTTQPTTLPTIEVVWNYYNSQPDIENLAAFDADLPTNSTSLQPGGDVTVNIANMPGNTYLIVRISDLEPDPTDWFNTQTNSGQLPDQVFLAPINERGYKYLISRVTPGFDRTKTLVFSH